MAKPKEVDFTFTLQSSGPIKTKKFQALVDTLLAQGTWCIEVEGDDVIVTSLTAGEVRKVEAEEEDVGPDGPYEQADDLADEELYKQASDELYEKAKDLIYDFVPYVKVTKQEEELQTKKPENPCADLLNSVYEEPTVHE